MKIVRRIAGEDIKRTCKIDNVNEWILGRKREWNEHMDEWRQNGQNN